jgi:hypothetical protein
VPDRWTYELGSHPDGGGRFLIAIHRYREFGGASTHDELEFETFRDAAAWLKETLNA